MGLHTDPRWCFLPKISGLEKKTKNPDGTVAVVPKFRHNVCIMCFIKYFILTLNLFIMLSFVITALVIALIAGVLGFTGIASGLASIAKIVFYIFLVVFVITLIIGLVGGSL